MAQTNQDLVTVIDDLNGVIEKMPLRVVMNALDLSTSIPLVTVIRDEFLVKLVFHQKTVSDQDVALSINRVKELAWELKKYRLSWLDRLSVCCRTYVQSYKRNNSSSGVPVLFRLCTWFYHLYNERAGLSSQVEINRVKLLSIMLHEPERQARRLIVNNRSCSWYLKKKRDVYYSGCAGSRGGYIWPQRNTYQHYIQTSRRSRVLVTIHMGDFIGALQQVSMVGTTKRKVITIRQGEDLDAIRGVIKHKERHEVLERSSVQPLKIVSSLRKGDATLVALTDLNHQFGETVTINFMGFDMEFVKGPVLMAMLGNADVVPVISYQKDGIDNMEVGPILAPEIKTTESIDSTVLSCMQTLFDWFESYIRVFPEQWKYLPECISYLSPKPENSVD